SGMGRCQPMTLAQRATTAVKRSPTWLAKAALAGAWALAVAVEQDKSAPAGGKAAAREPARADSGGTPPRGWALWKAVLYRVYNQIFEDRVLSLAGGVTFYVLLAIVPAITALVSVYALFADPATVQQHLSAMQHLMPASTYDVIKEQVGRIVKSSGGSLGIWFFAGLAISIWSANSGLKAIIDALNVVYGVKDERSFIKLNLVSLAMTVLGVVGIILAMAALIALPLMINHLPFGSFGKTLADWARWPALLAILMVGLAVLYRFGPHREHPRWEWVSPGNLFGAVAWIVGSAVLSWYMSNFANYNATYGSLGAAIALMMWLWITSIIVLLGAEINSEYYAARANRPKQKADKIGGAKAA
ncbi:MAG TPA: YihY/virulence factor BrkB family protein, partial [Pseudolabrys sp.]|nr:YihY/virulence factor BrkB family protein [Pseudolabrys sp.]